MPAKNIRVVALCGGVGGAKLALGLYRVLPPDELMIVVNTGDDFEHLGLHVSPDLDTVLYTLAGLSDMERGWGRAGETWQFMAALTEMGGESWFNLGDRDLAIHVLRTKWLRSGKPLSGFFADMSRRLGIRAALLPMSDDAVRTVVDTAEGALTFQRYFVERRCEPRICGIRFGGAATARPTEGIEAALSAPTLEAVIICPSNPYLSVDPILAVPALRAAVVRTSAPVVCVSPIIGGRAVKGPTRKIMDELGVTAGLPAIADHYDGLIDGLVADRADADEAAGLPVKVALTSALMRTMEDRENLAREVLEHARAISPSRPIPRHARRS
ncbi:MAG: 2-phospho-L-lactate transferase [Alphaproteobacteria bacterium]